MAGKVASKATIHASNPSIAALTRRRMAVAAMRQAVGPNVVVESVACHSQIGSGALLFDMRRLEHEAGFSAKLAGLRHPAL
jgi:hypothetical protein